MVTYMLLFDSMITIKEYIDPTGRNHFVKWFNQLNAPAAAKVATALIRMEQGNFSNTKVIGAGVLEYRIDFGPGYRIYFGREGDTLVILLGGGIKKRQYKDIETAKMLWKEYKRRKRQEN